METIEVELSVSVLEQLRREMSSEQVLPEVVKEAIELWLAERRHERQERERATDALRAAGLVLSSQQQRIAAQALLAGLGRNTLPTRQEVQHSLEGLSPSLSSEILRMRGEL